MREALYKHTVKTAQAEVSQLLKAGFKLCLVHYQWCAEPPLVAPGRMPEYLPEVLGDVTQNESSKMVRGDAFKVENCGSVWNHEPEPSLTSGVHEHAWLGQIGSGTALYLCNGLF